MRLLAVASREPAACQALAQRTSRCGGGVEPSGLCSIPLDVALHALLQWPGGVANEEKPGSSQDAAAAQLAAAIVLSNVADAAASATQGPGRYRAVTEPARLQVRCSGHSMISVQMCRCKSLQASVILSQCASLIPKLHGLCAQQQVRCVAMTSCAEGGTYGVIPLRQAS